jgi:hypothetical protein
MKRITRRATTVALATAAVTMGAVGVASANAPGGSETCPSGAFCVYYNSWQYGWGAFDAFYSNGGGWLNLNNSNIYFRYPGSNSSGYNDMVYHNVAAFVNNTGETWTLCTDNMNWCENYAPGAAGNVSSSIHNADGWIYG